MELINIDHPFCNARISTQGAQLLSWRPTHISDGVLWCTEEHNLCTGYPLRGGVPLCWPWFGKQLQPSHGFARILDWRLVDRRDDTNGVSLRWELVDTPWTRNIWPYPFLLQLDMFLGRTCHIALRIECEKPTTAALHTYLSVGDIVHTQISGLGGRYKDALQNMKVKTSEQTLVSPIEVDRIYDLPEPITILKDAILKRRLRLMHDQHSEVVVWNPGFALASDMSDLSVKDVNRFCCIETARIGAPMKDNDTLAVTLSVE